MSCWIRDVERGAETGGALFIYWRCREVMSRSCVFSLLFPFSVLEWVEW